MFEVKASKDYVFLKFENRHTVMSLDEAKTLKNDLDKAIKSIESHESTSYR